MRDHISYTQISTYIICPLKYRFQYIDRIEWPFKPAGLIFGSCLHKVLEHFYTGKKEGRDIKFKELWSIFEGSWTKEQNSKPVLYNSDSEKQLFAAAEKLLKLVPEKTNSNKIMAVEKDFLIELVNNETGEILPLPLKGKIDLIEKDKEGTITVVDHKTADRKFTKDKVTQDLQLSCYAAVMHHYGMDEQNKIEYRFDVYLKNKNPEIVSYTSERKKEDIITFFHTASNVIKCISNNVFYPNKGFFCTECVFKESCKNWRG